ncbi:DUF2065 domain-containing protein [Roseomonas oryzicola]|uniref:DUF2065 domain-containing protein n=1 Tax=Neoroseomonas oryzicola TaxID=535904 RepID=A0ABX1EFB7_9PROT|nr:DUF2065 domain-containing protein [Neoroseomonas oryzicola]NKE16496.1 DUF2065 domain-containing protein [Neoroseomonas oryzicola]
MINLLQGVAVVLALEGLLYAVAPGAMRRALRSLAEAPEQRLRVGGLVAAMLGIGLAWLLKA